jgi:hypothetical protein
MGPEDDPVSYMNHRYYNDISFQDTQLVLKTTFIATEPDSLPCSTILRLAVVWSHFRLYSQT